MWGYILHSLFSSMKKTSDWVETNITLCEYRGSDTTALGMGKDVPLDERKISV